MSGSRQGGNAIIMVLIAVVLFGALAYTFMRGAKSGTGNLSAQQTRIAAQEIINYAGKIERAVNKVRQRGCSEEQISFENSLDSDHANASAPSDDTCNIFESAGAGAAPYDAPANWFVDTTGGNTFYYTSGDPIELVGTDCTSDTCTELNLVLWNITQPLCEEINRQLGYSFTTVPTSVFRGCPFDGTYDCAGVGAIALAFTDANLKGKRAACFEHGTNDYSFASVLLER